MNLVRLLPVLISSVLIAAHFQRSGATIIACICLFITCLLFITRPWSVRIIQMLLILYALEWLRTLVNLVQIRLEYGLPWARLALILGGIALFTGLSTLVFRNPKLQKRFHKKTHPWMPALYINDFTFLILCILQDRSTGLIPFNVVFTPPTLPNVDVSSGLLCG